MPAIDISRSTANVLLPAEVSQEIWAKTLEESAIMGLARRVDMPGSGVDILGGGTKMILIPTGGKAACNRSLATDIAISEGHFSYGRRNRHICVP